MGQHYQHTLWLNSIHSTLNQHTGICPQDAKLCPDGSAVSRTGPDCSFAACPLTALSPTPTPPIITHFIHFSLPQGWQLNGADTIPSNMIQLVSSDYTSGYEGPKTGAIISVSQTSMSSQTTVAQYIATLNPANGVTFHRTAQMIDGVPLYTLLDSNDSVITQSYALFTRGYEWDFYFIPSDQAMQTQYENDFMHFLHSVSFQ